MKKLFIKKKKQPKGDSGSSAPRQLDATEDAAHASDVDRHCNAQRPRIQSAPHLDKQILCAALEVSPDVVPTASGPDMEEVLIQESVRAHLPQPPSELETELQRHLQAVQSVVLKELLRLKPLFELHGLMGVLIQNYHRALFKQLTELLLKTRSSRSCFQLLHWTLTKYLSQELFLHPDLQSSHLLQHMDKVLESDWTQQAQEELLLHVQAEVSSQLNHIVREEGQLLSCECEEDYIRTYVDVLQCIDWAPYVAQTFSPSLAQKLSQLCLRLLLSFTHSYKQQWFKWLETLKKKKTSNQHMVQLFRTLNTCKELRKYLWKGTARGSGVGGVAEKSEALLCEVEAFTRALVLDTVEESAENALKNCFKWNHSLSFLMEMLEKLFTPEPWLSLEGHEDTMDECYKRIVLLYVKHVSSHKLHKLRKSWSSDVASSVFQDAMCIHKIIYNLCPGVREWNFPLRGISEMLRAKDIDVVKVSTGEMLQKYKDNDLAVEPSLPLHLLQWKGLSRREIREVLESVEEVEPNLLYPFFTFCVIS